MEQINQINMIEKANKRAAMAIAEVVKRSPLPTYLRMCQHAGPSERKTLASKLPDTLRTTWKGKPMKVKELLMTEAISGTNLVQAEVYRTVTRGAQLFCCFRDAIPVYPTKSNSVKLPLDDTDDYAAEVAEGAEIPGITGSVSSTTFTVKKYGRRPLITRELVDDAMFDIVTNRITRAGRALENKLNQLLLTNFLDNAGNEHDSAGSNQGVKSVASAIGLLGEDGFFADTVILSPMANAMVLKDFVPGNFQFDEALRRGFIGNMLNCKIFQCGVADDSSTYTWGYTADSYIGMLVLDSAAAGKILMRDDIRVENYFDPIRDLYHLCCTMRYAYSYENANAISRVEY